jgi:hypothetical protein
MSTMTQVTQKEFEVLTSFHPGEVRYYVDINSTIRRNKGARIAVRREPSKAAAKPSVKPASEASTLPLSTTNRGRFIQLGLSGAGRNINQGTAQYLVFSTITRILENDPTKVMKRTDLTAAVDAQLPNINRTSCIVPAITTLLKIGKLRYTGDPAQ